MRGRGRPPLPPEEWALRRELLVYGLGKGLSWEALAAEFGVTVRAVWGWAKRLGIPTRPKGRPRKRP